MSRPLFAGHYFNVRLRCFCAHRGIGESDMEEFAHDLKEVRVVDITCHTHIMGLSAVDQHDLIFRRFGYSFVKKEGRPR